MTEKAAASPRIAVIVPVRNEQGNIESLVSEIDAALTPLGPFEIIYVNDGSTDGTPAELSRLIETRPHLRRIDHAQSCGQSAAVSTGDAFVSIRPHRIALKPDLSAATGPNDLIGNVERATYLGQHRDYLVTLSDGQRLKVTAPSDINVPTGAKVGLHLPPEWCRALPA